MDGFLGAVSSYDFGDLARDRAYDYAERLAIQAEASSEREGNA